MLTTTRITPSVSLHNFRILRRLADLVISCLFRLQELAAIQQEHRQEKTRLERSLQHNRTNTKRTGGRYVYP